MNIQIREIYQCAAMCQVKGMLAMIKFGNQLETSLFTNQRSLLGRIKMNKADQELWSIFEETVMFQTDRRSIKHSNQFGGTILAGRDLSQILWSFASLKQGSPNFWEMMENLLMDNAHAIDFKTFNKCLFSFYFAEKGSIEFWQYISKMNLNIPQKYLDASLLDDILFLSRIFQIKSDENVAEFNFNPLIQKFNQIVSSNQNEQILLNSRARLCYHQILLEKDNDLQQQNIFDIYLKKLQASSQQEDQKQWLQMYIDFTYMVFTLNLQDKFYNCLIEANRILINKMTKKDKSQEESSDEDEPSNIIEGMSRQIQEDESDDDQFQIGDQQEKYFSKQYSGISWVLYLNINESKQIPFEHKLELLDFLYNNFNIFLETDKKFSQIIQKILQPISGDKRVFEFFLQKLTSSKVNNPLQHFYLIFLICIKNNYRLDTYNLKNLLVQPKDQKQFEKEYQKIITKYKQMYAEPSRFDINQLLDQVLSHFIFPKQKVEDIVHFYKEQQQQANNLTSEFQQIKQDSMVSEKESDIEQIKTFMYENQSQEEKI